MDSCGTVFLIIVVVAVIAIPFVIQASQQHQEKLAELKRAYSEALSVGDSNRIVSCGRAVIEEVRTKNPLGLAAAADEVYQGLLRRLKANGELKPFTLEVGRIAYGAKRKEKTPTIYDEQAIQNDINAHS